MKVRLRKCSGTLSDILLSGHNLTGCIHSFDTQVNQVSDAGITVAPSCQMQTLPIHDKDAAHQPVILNSFPPFFICLHEL